MALAWHAKLRGRWPDTPGLSHNSTCSRARAASAVTLPRAIDHLNHLHIVLRVLVRSVGAVPLCAQPARRASAGGGALVAKCRRHEAFI